jgi:branched-chain amino acid transport system ATP-binding protein
MNVLETRGLTVTFGGNQAVDRVNVKVEEGQLVGLIGPNGAGKTTTIDAITGFVPSTGDVVYQGEPMTGLTSTTRARKGLGRTWQASELFDDLSVIENLQVAAEKISAKGFLRDLFLPRQADLTELMTILDSLDLAEVAEELPTDLSHGQRKLVGVARALAAKPTVLCLDEPAAGLDTAESQELGRRIRALVDGGLSVLMIDHDMGLVLGVCDYLYVLDFGQLIAEGTPAEIRANPDVIAAYLGESAESPDG